MNIVVRCWKTAVFALFLLQDLVLSTIRVAWEVMTPAKKRRQAIVAVPLDAKTDLEIAILANLITFTPGTMSVDVSSDRSILYIHAMFVDDAESFRHTIKDGYERRVLELVRGAER
jgi:multicomponent Na+:H+ antiporter subunit E